MPPLPTSVATLPWSPGLASTSCSSVPILSPTREESGDVSKLGACTSPMMSIQCPGFANTTLFSRTCFHLGPGGHRARRCRARMWFLHFLWTVGKMLTPDSFIFTHWKSGNSDVSCLLTLGTALNQLTVSSARIPKLPSVKTLSFFCCFNNNDNDNDIKNNK